MTVEARGLVAQVDKSQVTKFRFRRHTFELFTARQVEEFTQNWSNIILKKSGLRIVSGTGDTLDTMSAIVSRNNRQEIANVLGSKSWFVRIHQGLKEVSSKVSVEFNMERISRLGQNDKSVLIGVACIQAVRLLSWAYDFDKSLPPELGLAWINPTCYDQGYIGGVEDIFRQGCIPGGGMAFAEARDLGLYHTH